jgi:hypothetical protein
MAESDMQDRMDRIARAAMCGAELIELIPYFNGAKTVAAYQKFEQAWLGGLTADDLTYMRSVVGLPEPDHA